MALIFSGKGEGIATEGFSNTGTDYNQPPLQNATRELAQGREALSNDIA